MIPADINLLEGETVVRFLKGLYAFTEIFMLLAGEDNARFFAGRGRGVGAGDEKEGGKSENEWLHQAMVWEEILMSKWGRRVARL